MSFLQSALCHLSASFERINLLNGTVHAFHAGNVKHITPLC